MRIALPLEIAVRELDGKLWLGLNLINSGHEVIIGKSPAIHNNIDVIEPDVLFTFGAFKSNRKIDAIAKSKEAGCSVIFLDSEGGVFTDEESYLNRIYPEPISTTDWIYAWGNKPAEIIKRKAPNPEHVITTGNPRFDLLQDQYNKIYDDKAQRLKEEYDDFILVNTSFALGNYKKDSIIEEDDKINSIDDNEDRHKYLCIEFISLVRELSKNTPYNIVVRPHPSENHDTYKKAFSNTPSIFVRHEGRVRPWIKAATAVIHNNCTTGLESSLLETPTIAYEPNQANTKSSLPNEVSHTLTTPEEIINFLSNIGSYHDFHDEFNISFDRVEGYFANINNPSVDDIVNHVSNTVDGNYDGGYKPMYRKRIKRMLIAIAGDKNVTRVRQTGLRSNWEYSNQKFPYISQGNIIDRINQFSDFIDVSDMQIRRVRRIENTFVIK